MNNTSKLASGTTTKQAHALRKELSQKHEVPVRYISFGDCLKSAMGKRAVSKIRNAFGLVLGSKRDALTKILLCDPETPTVWTTAWIEDISASIGLSPQYAVRSVQVLRSEGLVNNNMGYWSVNASARPFPQPVLS